MTKTLLIIAIVVLIVYYCYWKQKQEKAKPSLDQENWIWESEENFPKNQEWITFLKTNLNSASLEELKTKLNGKTLTEILEQNEDQETEVDTLTRSKNSLEQDLTAQSNAFQNRLREKDRELKKAQADLKAETKRSEKLQGNLTSEKQQHKGSLGRITKLSEQITNLTKEHQDQLKAINCLFDEKAKDYEEIDFNGLYALLKAKANG